MAGERKCSCSIVHTTPTPSDTESLHFLISLIEHSSLPLFFLLLDHSSLLFSFPQAVAAAEWPPQGHIAGISSSLPVFLAGELGRVTDQISHARAQLHRAG